MSRSVAIAMNHLAFTDPTGRCLLVVSFLSAVACSSSVEATRSPGTWSVVSVPTTDGLTIVRGSSSTNVWIAGDTTILRWDGQTWRRVPDPALLSPPAAGLWVNSSSDVWLGAGTKLAYLWTGTAWTSTDLNDNRTAGAIWESGPSDVWASECGIGYLGHYDGTGWNHINSADNGIAIWGSGTNDVWMIEGYCDTLPSVIIHWHGASSISPCPPCGLARDTQFTFPRSLQAMWGSRTSDIWAVGDSGAIVHYDGNAWSQITNSPTTATLHGVWGTAANDVWAVGDSGLILHFGGSGWSRSVSPTTQTLHSAWGSPSGDVWAVGAAGTVLHLPP